MRIGEVNKDNYKYYLQLLGVKNQSLDNLYGEGKTERDFSFEARAKRMVELGYVMDGMMADEGDVSWKQIVPVPDSVKQAVIDYERKTFAANANGMVTAKQGDEANAIIYDYLKTIPPKERLSASWTLGQAAQAEAQRLVDYVKANVPGWKNGQHFDPKILTGTNYGLGNNLDVRA